MLNDNPTKPQTKPHQTLRFLNFQTIDFGPFSWGHFHQKCPICYWTHLYMLNDNPTKPQTKPHQTLGFLNFQTIDFGPFSWGHFLQNSVQFVTELIWTY